MSILNIVLFLIIILFIFKKASNLTEYDEKSKNIYNLKTNKYTYSIIILILIAFLISYFIIKYYSGNGVLEGLKVSFISIFLISYRKVIISKLKNIDRTYIEEEFENIRYECYKDIDNGIKIFKDLNISDSYKYYKINKVITDEYIALLLVDKMNDNNKYPYKIFINNSK